MDGPYTSFHFSRENVHVEREKQGAKNLVICIIAENVSLGKIQFYEGIKTSVREVDKKQD